MINYDVSFRLEGLDRDLTPDEQARLEAIIEDIVFVFARSSGNFFHCLNFQIS